MIRGLLAVTLILFSVVTAIRAAENDRRLIDAVKQGNRETVLTLMKARIPVNAVASDGTTALHWAVRANDQETVRLLLSAGADVRLVDRYGIPPLKLAAENGNPAV